MVGLFFFIFFLEFQLNKPLILLVFGGLPGALGTMLVTPELDDSFMRVDTRLALELR